MPYINDETELGNKTQIAVGNMINQWQLTELKSRTFSGVSVIILIVTKLWFS